MSQSPAPLRIRPWRWILALLTLGVIVVGLPATSASAAADGVLKGTVTFHESTPDRTLTAYHETTDGAWVSDSSSVTTIASTGTYSVSVPAGVPVKLRVSFGNPDYSYWYGDVFNSDVATSVTATAGQTVSGINLSVPEPISYSGRLVDRGGKPVAGAVTPTVNTDGASMPLVPAPIAVDSSGGYQVFLPAKAGGVYEGGVMATTTSGDAWSWLGGGDGYEPNYYLNPQPGEVFTGQNIELPLGTSSVAPDKTQGNATALHATRTPVVRGAVRKGHVLRSTAGTYNKRPTTVRYQWLRNGKAITGANHRSYKLRKADVRKHIRVRVTAYSGSAKVLATSARTAAIRAR
jgi:hypothetical protein